MAKHHIFFVDDELEVCEVVSETLEESGYEVSHFTRTADCLERLRSEICHLLITDLKMPKMDGIELLTEAKRLAPWMPVLVITGYGDIPTAVAAIKAGAADFIEKPLDRDSFLNKVASILRRSPRLGFDVGKPLTDREKRILKLVTEGKSNREIAFLLHRSVRTVEAHRSNLMEKLGVDNLVDLVKLASRMGLVKLPEKRKRGKTGKDTRNSS